MEIPVAPIRPNSTKVATKWALIFTLTAIIITYVIQFANLDPNSATKYLTYLPFIGFLLLAQKEFKDELGGYLTFSEGFSSGFRYAVFSGVLVAVFSFLYFLVLNHAAWQKIVDTTRAQMEAQNAPDATIDKAMSIMNSGWSIAFACFVAAIMYAIFGAITALVGAAILKKERSPFDIAENAVDPNEVNP